MQIKLKGANFMIMSKAIIITHFAEFRNVRLHCEKCGNSVIVNPESDSPRMLYHCSNCMEPFNPLVAAYALELKKFADNYRKLLGEIEAKQEGGGQIWLESELKVT